MGIYVERCGLQRNEADERFSTAPHFDLMFLAVIHKGNSFLALLDTINDYFHFALTGLRAQDGNVLYVKQ